MPCGGEPVPVAGQTQRKVMLTGIKPTGTPHVGNYLGMLKPALAAAREAGAR